MSAAIPWNSLDYRPRGRCASCGSSSGVVVEDKSGSRWCVPCFRLTLTNHASLRAYQEPHPDDPEGPVWDALDAQAQGLDPDLLTPPRNAPATTYRIPPGIPCEVSRDGVTWTPHTTTRESTFPACTEDTPDALTFTRGGWRLRVSRAHV